MERDAKIQPTRCVGDRAAVFAATSLDNEPSKYGDLPFCIVRENKRGLPEVRFVQATKEGYLYYTSRPVPEVPMSGLLWVESRQINNSPDGEQEGIVSMTPTQVEELDIVDRIKNEKVS